jgi:hypothetical protein
MDQKISIHYDFKDDTEFIVSEKQLRLERLAKEYHDEVEAYDLRICSLRSGSGYGKPGDYRELGLINRNAIKVKKRFVDTYFNGMPNADFNRAIQTHHWK